MSASLELRVALGRFGLAVEEASPELFRLRGDTLVHDQLLQELGACWLRAEQAWELAGTARLEELRYRLEPQGYALREEAPTWDGEQVEGGGSLSARLRQLPMSYWTAQELVEGLLHFATPTLQQRNGPLAGWLLERFGSLGAILRMAPDRLIEHDLFSGQASQPMADQRSASIAFMIQLVDAVLQHVLREQIKERPVIGSWTALMDYLAMVMQHEPVEHFRILFLDRKNILIRDEVQSRGTVDHTPLYPREVVKRALDLAASAFIMVHNHPSGDPTPSQADIDMTRQVVAAAAVFGIAVHDHIIVGKNRHTSFKTQRLI